MWSMTYGLTILGQVVLDMANKRIAPTGRSFPRSKAIHCPSTSPYGEDHMVLSSDGSSTFTAAVNGDHDLI